MVMRIGGLASGMDIDKIVGDLMKAERMPLDKLFQRRQILEWQRDDYRSMNTLLQGLNDRIFNGIYKQSSFTQKIVTSSNESAVSVKNVSSTSNVYSSIWVNQLAEAGYMNSASGISADPTFDPSKTLATEGSKLSAYTQSTFSIQSIQADGTMGTAVSFTVDPNTDSLNSIINRINNSDAGVNVFYDSQTGKISMTAKNTGDAGSAQAEIVVSGDFLTSALKLDTNNDGANGMVGKNAILSINGINTERFSNTFQINGYEYSLKQVTDDGDGVIQSSELVTISSRTDTDSIFNMIKDFVDSYNDTISKINGELSEERFRSYQPLTSEQKKDLSDSDAELWEAKAKSGLIRNDLTLSTGLNTMRTDLYNSVQGLTGLNQLTDIGITTSSYYMDKGKLVIDEAKLRDAIDQDPMGVYKLFNQEMKDGNGNIIKDQSGIAVRLHESINGTISQIESKAGNTFKTTQQYSIGRNINSLNDQINDFEGRLRMVENRYWQQFTAMERALQKSNEQSSYLMQQFSQM